VGFDPICGREVAEDSWSLEYADTKFWFCSQACRDDFRRAPRMLIALGPKAAGRAAPEQRGEAGRRAAVSLAS